MIYSLTSDDGIQCFHFYKSDDPDLMYVDRHALVGRAPGAAKFNATWQQTGQSEVTKAYARKLWRSLIDLGYTRKDLKSAN